ncbi:MAG TPA: IclR family transcriptional regulator [Stackebrandtia sp.]|jgi:DNA-binding IclR family transcriptional regulator|uniref:IclR family transcriptional regulator n=1 Tax=Stackebrandtia sp. TaxID=2023065 RepID=UPI002D63253F|nr:IclR family transcriptional regulator [Stackebrandtia sp.]HZE38083.1 IclR family transcriptional regulator [Stackebrandtia sp.]
MSNDSLSSVRRALNVLCALGEGPQRVQDVATALGKEKSQVSRTLKVLAEQGFVERDPETMEYRLGRQLFALAGTAGDDRLHRDGPVVLRSLVRQLGEAAYLTVLAGGAAVTVLTERPRRALQAHEWIGRATPLNCTSCGRALLLGLPDDEVTDLLAAHPQPLPGSGLAPRTTPEVLQRLRAERSAGYVVAAEEYEPGLTAVAVPITDFRGTVVAALNVSAPVFRLPPEALPHVIEAVTIAGTRLSTALGAR